MSDVSSTPGELNPAAPFEEVLSELSRVVERLESGELPLEESLAVFERGIHLSRIGARRLDEAERRVEILLTRGEAVTTIPLEEPDSP